MTIIVCGSRSWRDEAAIRRELGKLDYGHHGILRHGDCAGADQIAGGIAGEFGWIEQKVPAQWEFHGRGAGPIRNQRMIDMAPEPELVLAFTNKIIGGTWDMIRRAVERGIEVRIYSS